MEPGTQIAYIPNHANGDIIHPAVEFGYVTSESGDNSHFCRYWIRGHPGMLRTVANSELTPNRNLVKHNSVLQGLVDSLMQFV